MAAAADTASIAVAFLLAATAAVATLHRLYQLWLQQLLLLLQQLLLQTTEAVVRPLTYTHVTTAMVDD